MTDGIEVRKTLVTPERAAEWLAKNHFPRQRARRPKHVTFLAAEITAGRFRKGTPVEFGVFNGHAHLVNGQHTLAAIELAGVAVELIVIRHEVGTEEELSRLYTTHDSGLTRSWNDAYAAMDLNQKYNMADAEINAYGRSAPYIAGAFTYRGVRDALASKSRSLRLAIMEAYHPSAKLFLTCLEQAEPPIRKALMMPPLFALGTFTISADPDRATRFWTMAADDQNLSKTDPPKVATILAQRIENSRQKTMIGLAQSVIVVWNAYVQDREIKSPRMIRNPTDIVQILATPLADTTAETEAASPLQPDGLDQAREMFGEVIEDDDEDGDDLPTSRPSARREPPEART